MIGFNGVFGVFGRADLISGGGRAKSDSWEVFYLVPYGGLVPILGSKTLGLEYCVEILWN